MDLSAGATLEAREVSFRFGGRAVLDRASFAVRPGEIASLLGANGAGKTTLLRLLLGLERPCRGEVLLGGMPLHRLSRRAVARAVAYIPQSHAPAFPYRVRDVVLLGRTPSAGLLRPFHRRDREAAAAALEAVGIAALADRPYTQLSGGERQLALIARALAQGAKLLVMDEPFAGVDYGHQQRLLAQLTWLASEGAGIALTTHDPEQAMRASNRAAMLAGGRIVADGPPEKVLSPEAILSIYGVRVEVLRTAAGMAVLSPLGAAPERR